MVISLGSAFRSYSSHLSTGLRLSFQPSREMIVRHDPVALAGVATVGAWLLAATVKVAVPLTPPLAAGLIAEAFS